MWVRGGTEYVGISSPGPPQMRTTMHQTAVKAQTQNYREWTQCAPSVLVRAATDSNDRNAKVLIAHFIISQRSKVNWLNKFRVNFVLVEVFA